MKKYVSDLRVVAVEHPREGYTLLRLTDDVPLPAMHPGQFVEVRVDGSPQTFLRRPISINFVDRERNELWLLVHEVGEGTCRLGRLAEGSTVNCMYPLGRGFTLPKDGARVLLVGGGVGTAPLLYHGACLCEAGCHPTFLLGGRSDADVLQKELFERYGRLFVTTEDGSAGYKGFVTQHPLWESERFDLIATCGPKPMMVAVARLARAKETDCEASLENMMACGLGACLCCVEKTRKGNLCVCKEGPVFHINDLTWLN